MKMGTLLRVVMKSPPAAQEISSTGSRLLSGSREVCKEAVVLAGKDLLRRSGQKEPEFSDGF